MAVDGSDLQKATNPEHKDSYFPNIDDRKAYKLIHLNAMYDLLSRTYIDAIAEGQQIANEQRALNRMVDRTNIQSAIVPVDRGYKSWITRNTHKTACDNTLYQCVQIMANLAVLLSPFFLFLRKKY